MDISVFLGICAIVLLVFDLVAYERVGAGLWFLLIAFGALSPSEGLAVIVDPAVVTISALYVLGFAIQKSGAFNLIGRFLVGSEGEPRSVTRFRVGFFFFVIAVLSMFLNNTAVVIILIPVALELGRRSGISTSKLLIPISYVAILGGAMTLIGTSTNLLVAQSYSELIASNGLDFRKIEMFSFIIPGFAAAVAGGVWLTFFGRKLLPDTHIRENLTENYELNSFMVAFRIQENSILVGKNLEDSGFLFESGVELVEIHRKDHNMVMAPHRDTLFVEGDEFLVRVDPDRCGYLSERYEIQMIGPEQELQSAAEEGLKLGQALVVPGSQMAGRTIGELSFRDHFGLTVLSIRHGSKPVKGSLMNYRLRVGDTLLLHGTSTNFEKINEPYSDLVIVSENKYNFFHRKHANVAILALFVFIFLAYRGFSLDLVSIVVVGGMLIFNTVKIEEAIEAVDHKVVVLLVGLLAWSNAMYEKGIFDNFVQDLQGGLQNTSSSSALIVIYLLVAIATSFLSNAATAITFVPLVLTLCTSMNWDPYPFMLAVAIAASASFATPIGYQTNTLVFSLGQYKFKDFIKIGIPMTLITGAAACWTIIYYYL
ncbi:hypothetical protein CL659_01910 [bacterium]|nr:hypothetical protein [bacterium]|tara:strand:- start:1045 stop:2835 length:1791 start_codon:yes stop_codon:yes gene_type:complete